MAVQVDKVQLIVGVDTKEGIRELGYLQAEYYRLIEAQKKTTSYTEQQNLNNAIGVLKDKIAEARKEYGLAGMNAKELRQYQRELVSEQNRYAAGTDQYKELQVEIEKVSQHMLNVRKNTAGAEEEQQLLRAQLLQTIQDYGTEALSIEQLKRLQGQLYDDLTKGAKSGNLANGDLAKSYQQVAAAVAAAEAQISKTTVTEKSNLSAIQATVKTNGIKALSLEQLRQYHRHLTAEIEKSADFESEINKKRIQEAQEVNAAIGQREEAIDGSSSFFENMKGQFPAALIGGLAGGIAGAITDKVGEVFSAIKAQIDAGIKYLKEKLRDISDIQTTLNTDIFSATKIYSDLGKIDTERPREQLKELVLIAGDLNVAQKDIKSFVESSDKLEKVFERDFSGVGQASSEIAKLKDTFRETRDLKIEESFNKIGSSIKVLNEAGPASTKGITEYISRIGQISEAFKPAIQDAAALGAVFEEANLTAEIASSGTQKILLTASQNGKQFGEIFGMAKKEFLEFLTTDPTGFLTKLAEKFKNLDNASKGEYVKNLKINDAETFKTLSVLGDNLDKFYTKQRLSNEAFIRGTRIDEIFRVFNNDGSAEIAKAEKKYEIFFNKISGFLGQFGKSVKVDFANVFPDLQSEVDKANKKFEEQKKLVEALDIEIQKHINTIKEFKNKGDASGISQQQLRTAIDNVAEAIPSAITQFDNLGRAMDINTTAAENNIKRQRDLAREFRQNAIDSNKETLNELLGQQEQIQKDLNSGTTLKSAPGVTKLVRLTDTEINEFKTQQKIIGEDIEATRKYINQLDNDLDTIENRRASRRKDNPLFEKKTSTEPTNLPDGDDKAEDAAKKRQDQYRKEIDLLAELAFKRDQYLADDENKKVNFAIRQRDIQKTKIEKEVEDSERRKTALELNEQELANALESIQTEYSDKREKQVSEQVTKSIEIAQRTALYEKQVKVTEAEASEDAFAIYNAKFALNDHLRNQELANLAGNYNKQKDLLKDNAEATKKLEENYAAEVLAIKAKYVSEDDKLLIALLKNTKEKSDKSIEIKKKAELEKAKLDLQEAEQTPGGNVLQSKIAVLNAEMQAELNVANLTEQEKTNIVRKFDLERRNLQRQSHEQIAAQALQLFGEAFSSITGIFTQQLQNREISENETYTRSIERLEEQKEKSILTDKEYKFQKTATEKAHDKELKRIRYEQAKIEKTTNITQAVINGVQAVMKGYAQAGPLGGIPLAIIMGAISALQIGKIAATPLPSLYKGGPTPDRVEKPIDSLGGFLAINHPGEYMVPAVVRQTPLFAAIEPMLESIRLNGRSNYSLPSVSIPPAISPAAVSKPFEINSQGDAKLYDVLDKLNSKLDNLQVYFGGHDYEKFREGLADFTTQNDEAFIDYDKI